MLWVTVDGTGATKVLASSLLLDETADSMAWSCQCFKDCFRVPPRVIFSDSAPAIKLAVASVFPEPHTLVRRGASRQRHEGHFLPPPKRATGAHCR